MERPTSKQLGVIVVGLWILAFVLFARLVIISPAAEAQSLADPLTCNNPSVVDGDTLHCMGARIRLIGIDAPEMPGHCNTGRACTAGDPYASREHLVAITRATVKCYSDGVDRYQRTLARCRVGDTDLSCEMIASGHAVPRYRDITCPRR